MKNSFGLKAWAAAAGVAMLCGQASAAVGLTWILPPGGQSWNIKLASNGTAATGVMSNPDGTGGVYRWDAAAGIKPVETQGNVSAGPGISGDGKVVVGGSYAFLTESSWRWSEVGGLGTLTAFSGGPANSWAHDASGNGSVIVGDMESGFALLRAYKWTPSTGITALPVASGHDYSQALAVSDNGKVIVGQSGVRFAPFGSGTNAVLWDSSGMVDLGTLPGGLYGSWALDVSASGNAVVGVSSSSSGMQAFRWMADTGMMGLGYLPGSGQVNTQPLAVSGDGRIVVGNSNSIEGSQAFVWDELHGMLPLASVMQANGLDVTGWNITQASGISADGNVIAATRMMEGGALESFIVSGLTIIPEPSSAGLMGLALGGMMLRRRRGRA